MLAIGLATAWMQGLFREPPSQPEAVLSPGNQTGSGGKPGALDAGPSGRLEAAARGLVREGTTEKTDVQAIVQFSNWATVFLAADPQTKAQRNLLSQGESLARNRRRAMKELIRTDPRQALALAVAVPTRRQLPEAISQQLEERVSGQGFFKVLVADDLDSKTCEVQRQAGVGGKTYQACVYGRRVRDTSQSNVPLQGIAVDSVLAVEDKPGSGRSADGTSAQPALYGDGGGGTGTHAPIPSGSWTQGTKTLLLMRVAFPDDPAEPITEAGAYAMLNQVNQFYVENSYGTTAIIPQVTPLLILPQYKDAYAVLGTVALQADAREAARSAGMDTDDYDLDIVLFNRVPGPAFNGWNGQAYIGAKGLWMQGTTSAGVAAHELGHNYGLYHANFWSATGGSVIGPGSNSEYGNTFDTMGAANAGIYQFNAGFKSELNWLTPAFVQSVTTSGLFRLYAYDVPQMVSGRHYALQVAKDYDRNYWAEFRQKFTGNPWLQNGILLNWDAWDNNVSDSAGGTDLLDTTPGTPAGNSGKDDSAVVIGRTFSDPAAGVFFTPIGKGSEGSANWIDVQVNLGMFASNTAPFLQLAADQTSVPTNVPANFTATATDAEGDPLAYYWDFGDGTFGSNAPAASKSWNTSGDYLVRCTVSDMKGGVASRYLVMTIGSPATYRASGRVTTSSGEPIENVRVHNGLSGSSYRGGYTDSDGYYVLANLAVGSYTLSAVKYGYALAGFGWANPVTLGPNVGGLDWTATASPAVRVLASDAWAVTPNPNPDTGTFTVSRSGPLAAPLTVKFNLAGTAAYQTDYDLNPALGSSPPYRLTIAAGLASANLVLVPKASQLTFNPETATLALVEDPAYVLGTLAGATITITNSQASTKPSVNVLVNDSFVPETGPGSGSFLFTRDGNLRSNLTVFYSISGTASNGVDYLALPGVVTIPAGETSAWVAVTAIDNLLAQGNETATLTVVADAAYQLGANASATVVIVDNNPPLVFTGDRRVSDVAKR